MNVPLILAVIAFVNTLCAWGIVFVTMMAHDGEKQDIRIALTGVGTAMFVFLAERGFRHLEFRASAAEGVVFHADAPPDGLVATTTVETAMTAIKP